MVARARGTTTNRNGVPVGGEPSLISMPKPKNAATAMARSAIAGLNPEYRLDPIEVVTHRGSRSQVVPRVADFATA